ncbi:terminase small subunit [Pseudomonas monteilii]|uniref:terminase small subunit n=1 Tax=Pseudomonas monteilii TaxID=76759 RepID=UPI001E42BF4C|nr:terminase small subunit [Pseudomonas monteilii]MCE0931643.1 terminase small subunit [Pseudomonas monteilii]MCE1007473.1 terminase small subunit [Pseudomonas monteilii]WJN90199.1 terminase small subunit [Pseudomonas monteilii]WJO34811.1 terminase small subunit [Pseudomonas monteilii]WJR41156.1 terminase small subunit [Pseudomonas monteilii]
MAMTVKRHRFVAEYLKDLNATQAAIRAGYAKKGAKDQAYQLMQMPEVAEAIKAAMEERNKRLQVDADYVLHRLTEIDQLDLADIFDLDGKLMPIRQWPLIWRQMVKEVDMKTGKVKFHDKLRALELIGKHVNVNAFREQVNHTGEINFTDMTDEELERRIAKLSGSQG